jgi:hypothetical protein
MRVRHIFMILVLALLLVTGSGQIGLTTGQKKAPEHEDFGITQTLRIMGKGPDHIVVGEEPLYVLPEMSKITDISGSTIRLARLRVPCLAEITYATWMRGVDKLPVILHLKVKKVYRGASAVEPSEK